MSGNKKHRTANEILKYLRGETPDRERYDFERQMESDSFVKEAMDGLANLSPAEAGEDILALHARLRKRLSRRRRITLYSAAATVASLLIIGTIFLQIYDFNPKKEQGALSEEEIPVISRDHMEPGEAAASEKMAEAPVNPAEPGKSGASEQTGEKTGTAQPAEPSERVPVAVAAEEAPALKDEIVVVEAAESAGEGQAGEPAGRAGEARVGEAAGKAGEGEVGNAAETAAEEMAVETAEPVARNQVAAAPKTSGRKMAVTRAEFAEPVPGEVKGVVLSAGDLAPLPGALVYQKERDTGVVTDMQGRFTLPAESDRPTTLVASFVGMETGEYPVHQESEVKLILLPDQSSLNEPVMIGYEDGTTYRSLEDQTTAYPVSGRQKASRISARPVTGYEAYSSYIKANLQFPSGDSAAGQAVVVLQFTVTSDGKIRDIRPLRTPGESFTREAARLIREGPAWNPATGAPGTTDDVVVVRILFKK
jgi:hypothetical protein